jgi:hypothetical protein
VFDHKVVLDEATWNRICLEIVGLDLLFVIGG